MSSKKNAFMIVYFVKLQPKEDGSVSLFSQRDGGG